MNSIDAVAMIEDCDPAVFAIESQTSIADRVSLLALQNVVRRRLHTYSYLEIGSYLGGSLLPHLLDPRCSRVCSVDKRPAMQPDERGRSYDYHVSTADMIGLLARYISPGSLLKLETIDADVSEILQRPPVDFVFIDAEHTNEAVFRDFLMAYRFISPDGMIGFHDAVFVTDALVNIVALLNHQDVDHRMLIMHDNVAVILLGESIGSASALARMSHSDNRMFFTNSKKLLWEQIRLAGQQ